jgi:nucleoside permease NupC
MFKNTNLNLKEFNRQLTPEALRPIKIIVLALNIGALLIHFVGIIMYYNGMETSDSGINDDYAKFLLLVEAVFVCGVYMTAKIIPDRMMQREEESSDVKMSTAQNIIGYYQTYMIIKLALLEGASLFGFVVFFTGITNNVIYGNPIYWLSIAPVMVLLVYSALNFPNAERAILFYEKFKN